jgi:Kef-type K+ transport system membrane component KefB
MSMNALFQAFDSATRTGHVALVLLAICLIVLVGRLLARVTGQPSVVGEVAAGLVVGPVVVAIGGHRLLNDLLPTDVFAAVRQLAHIGLVLFIVGAVREMRTGGSWATRRTVGWVTFGALIPPLAAGFGLAGWVMWRGDAALRGDAPTASFILMIGVALTVTAIPVLARILSDRSLTYTRAGRLSMAAAAVIDGIGWLLLSLAISLAAGDSSGCLDRGKSLLIGVGGALVLMRLLRTGAAARLVGRFPWPAAVAVAAIGLTASWLLQRWGLSEVIGALLVGAALPADDARAPWGRVIGRITRVGAVLVPIFFVVTGVMVFAKQLGAMPWAATVLATVLGIAAKIFGSYLGSRLGGESRLVGLRVGVLMNTRGLTELVVLQAGFTAGILTPEMFLALVIMALVATAATGPLYTLLDRQVRTAEDVEMDTSGVVRV